MVELSSVPVNPAPDGTYRVACNRLYFFSTAKVRLDNKNYGALPIEYHREISGY